MPRELTQAPPGFTVAPASKTIVKDASVSWDRSNLVGRYKGLLEWAEENRVQLAPTECSEIKYTEWAEIFVWTTFSYKVSYKPDRDNHGLFAAFKCPGCSQKMACGEVFCSNCLMLFVCTHCRVSGLSLYGVKGSGVAYCAKCSHTCSTRGCSSKVGNPDHQKCDKCDPREACGLCATVFPTSSLKKHTAPGGQVSLCKDCTPFICLSCKKVDRSVKTSRFVDNKVETLCQACVDKIFATKRAKLEKWPSDEMPPSKSLVIPSSSERPIRTISIETEFNGDGVKVGKALFDAGLTSHAERGRYSEQGASGRYPCFLKTDGTVTGGELVTFLLDLDNENHAAALLRMTEVMRSCRELGLAQFTSNAGGHIHIDLHGFSIGDLWTYDTLFKHLQMPLYYLAGAGASYGQRSIGGNSFSSAQTAGPFQNKREFIQSAQSMGRSGMHFSNFTAAMRGCRCGAQSTGEWESCTCDFPKATSEWRLWNAEINPRILHAWLALMMSITAYAQENEINHADFPYLLWTARHFNAISAIQKDGIKNRLEWMHSELPLTDEERDSIVYACKQSELKDLGSKYLDSLLKIESHGNFSQKKAARNPVSRKGVRFEVRNQEVSA